MINESSLAELYTSTVKAFPKTTLRQFATQPIIITKLDWVPFPGLGTLFIKGLAQHEGREYNPMLLFKEVKYGVNEVSIWGSDGLPYQFQKLSLEGTEVFVRCNCPDFYWRFNFANSSSKSLFGRKRAKYESKGILPPVNPTNAEGMCKHLMKTVHVIRESGVIN